MINIKEQRIGDIGNYYGSLWIKKENNKCYWSIENYDGHDWSEIPENLFLELEKYQEQYKNENY